MTRRPPAKKVLTFAADADNAELANVTGALDANLRQIETELDVSIARRGHQFRIEGAAPQAQAAIDVLEHFLERSRRSRLGRPAPCPRHARPSPHLLCSRILNPGF